MPDRRQAIIWTNAGLLLIGPLGTNFIEIFIEILTFSFKQMRLKVSSAKRRPFCLDPNVLNTSQVWRRLGVECPYFLRANYLWVIDRLPLYPESNSVPRFGVGGKAGAAQMRGKPPGL